MPRTLSPAQRGVLLGMGAGLLLSPGAPALAVVRSRAPRDTLAWGTLLPLLLSIGALAKHRFFTPEDIDGSGLVAGTQKAALLQATLQNTLEQTVLAAVVYAGFAAAAPPRFRGAIPAAVVLFLAGRLLFARGYASGASARAPGFALTVYPTDIPAVSGVAFLTTGLLGG